MAVKVPCKAASTSNITLSGEQTIDGVSVVADDRVLVTGQTDGTENGIYKVASGSWSRSQDWNDSKDCVQGTAVYVHSGTSNAGWYGISTSGTITPGTTDVTIGQSIPGGSNDANINVQRTDTSAELTTVHNFNEKRITIMGVDYGASLSADGVDDWYTVLTNAMTDVNASGGGVIFFPCGTFLVGTALAIPSNVVLMGSGKGNTTIKRGFTGNLATQAGYSGLMYLTIDGDTATQGAGKGIVFSGSTPSAYHLLVEIKNFVEPCLEFGVDAGATFRGICSDYYTTGSVGSVGAVTVNGTDTGATSRHFIGCESGGCTLYDFGGANDLYVTGGFSNLLIFGAAGSKIFINNMRIGNTGTTTISSDNCRLADCVFAGPVIISGDGNHFDCEVPSWNITDNGTTNQITHPTITYTSSWTSSGTAPSLGNGTLNAYYSRQGSKIKVTVDFTIGSTSTVGTGAWRFSLPRADYSSTVQMCGSGWCSNAAGTAAATFAVRVSPGNQYVELFYADSSEAPQNVGATTPAATWGTGATVRFSCEYITT